MQPENQNQQINPKELLKLPKKQAIKQLLKAGLSRHEAGKALLALLSHQRR